MKNSIQGSITIRISDDEMMAYLDYKPSQVLLEWTDDVIIDLLKEAGVKKGYKEFHFSRIYRKILQLKEEGSFDIATGLEPRSSGHGQFDVISRPPSKSLELIYNSSIDSSDKPIIFLVNDDFTLGEEVENLSFVVLRHFYIDEGEVVALFDKDGKSENGYTVTGKKLVPSQDEEDNTFCISEDFNIDNGKIKALKSGFIRVGKDWLDLIPFAGHQIKVEPSEDFAEFYLTFIPGSRGAPIPTFDDILSRLGDTEYPFEFLKEESIVINTIKKAVAGNKTIKISLSKKRKAKAHIDTNQSKTKAVLILEKGAGTGEKLSLKTIGALIRESKIKGMNLDSLKKRILNFYKSKELSLQYVILEGKIATRGEPRKLKYQKEFISVDKIDNLVHRINKDIEAFYPSFKVFNSDNISSAILVKKGFEFAFLTDSIPGDDGIDIYGNKIKGLVGNDPIIKTFENISIKQDKYISEIDGILDLGEVDGETLLRVREHKDMFVDISIFRDGMSACFTFYKAEGSGETASMDFIMNQIEAAGVVKGIDSSVVEGSLKKFENGDLISEVVFAKGQIPTDKKSSRIKYFNNKSGKTQFSYEIEKGSSIAQILPSRTASEDGYDVLGTIMESSGVVSLDLKMGDYILEEKQDDGSVILTADINGELKVNESSIEIIDKKILSGDVSAKTGSIKTLCSIVIKGSVLSSLYVVSGGNIKIMGTVQGALISADKNIIISQGVKGEDKAILRAKEKIDVKFIENGNMMAVDDIHIRKAALHAKIISNGRVLFDKAGSKIVGGETFTKRGIYVDEIGSPSGGKTIISFGQDYLVADKIKVFEGDVDKIQQDLMKIDQILLKPGGNNSPDKITHLRKQKVFLMKKLEKKNMKLFLLREKFEEHAKSEIIVRSKIYPGVIFESHGRKLEIIDEEPMCKIVFNPNTGQIEKHR